MAEGKPEPVRGDEDDGVKSKMALLETVRSAYTAGRLKRSLAAMGFISPSRITDMYLRSEPAEYVAAAVMCVTSQAE